MKTSYLKIGILTGLFSLILPNLLAQTVVSTPTASPVTIFSTPESKPKSPYQIYRLKQYQVEMAYLPAKLIPDPEYDTF